MKAITHMLESMDNENQTIHSAEFKLFSDGSGCLKVIDTSTGETAWFVEFESETELETFVAGRRHASEFGFQKTANNIADILAVSTSPEVDSALWDFFTNTLEEADIFHPETIRRVYPIVARLNAETAAKTARI